MARDLCLREQELIDAMMSGAWSNPASSSELRVHVTNCKACAEVVTVASALLDARLEDEVHIRVPSSGATWWRMELRAKRESRAVATSAVEVTQVAIIVGTLLLAFTIAGVGSLLSGAFDLASLKSLIPSVSLTFPMWVTAAFASLLLMPVALYFAVTKE